MRNRNLTANEVCKAIGVSRPTLQRLLRAQRIGCFRVGTGGKARVLFAPEHVRQFLQSCECPARVI